ncbi:Geranylgeranyl transferase type I subunit beta [Caenorhabditis elegans]|nr:Geranylgeranyl transferase type I subunit beta [Caenorhabditis elegans]CAT01082.2 Geranylgeranyl transferase type I subunit beta [Caenorhabditis elegans]|eukprot:NP_001254399.2 Uncharacterized protein CELE_Y48E1B.3 [Caenorhabditis elegans]
MLPPLKNDTAAPKAKEPLLELRTSSWSSPLHTGLFLRSPTLLQLMNFREEEASSEEDPVIYEKHIPIFNFAVKSFTESELLEQTLAVVDFGGRVWICGGGGGFSSKPMKLRANEQEIYQLAAFCDHPKLIAVAGHFHVEIVDMRSPAAAASSRACAELWRSPLFESRGREEAMYLQAVPPVSAQIRHVSRLQGTANAYCVMTDRTLHLIDDRFPGRPVLGLKHAFSSGTHRMVVSNPVGDEAAGGNVYSIFCQDQLQVLNSSISMTKLYAHPTGVWSSVDAFHSIGEPENFNQIVRRGKYAEPEVPSEPTRAMDLVELSDLKCSLLVRQTDDGAIWWQKFSNEPVRTEKEQFSEQKKSLERIIERRSREPDSWKREPWRPVYSDGMCEEVREKPEDFRKIVPVSCPDIDRRVISKYNQYATTLSQQANRFRISSHLIKQPLEVIPLDDINSTLSKITLDTWQATENMMKENRQKQ